MNIRIEKCNLEAGINAVIKAVSVSATSLPVLRGILIIAEAGQITLTGNNLDMAITTSVSGMILEGGKTVIDGKLLAEVVKKLPDGQTSIEVADGTALIRCEKAKFKLPVMEADEYPVIPLLDGENGEVNIEKTVFKDMAAGTLFALALNDGNKMLTGGYLEAFDGTVSLTALDGHRVSIVRRKADSSGNLKVIIPGRTLAEVAKQMKGTGSVRIICTESHCRFDFDETKILTRLISGKYYTIDKMINMDSTTSISIQKDALTASVDRGITITGTQKKPLVFQIGDGCMRVTANSSLGELDEELTIDKTGNDLHIGLNPHFLMDALKVIPDETVNIRFSSGRSPFMLTDEKNSYIYLILPVNIG